MAFTADAPVFVTAASFTTPAAVVATAAEEAKQLQESGKDEEFGLFV